jgi:hypothetical protein
MYDYSMKNHKAGQDKPITASERRQIENEVVFRQMNEKVEKGLKKLDKMAKAEGYHTDLQVDDMVLNFYCECSDENCHQRIPLTLKKYEELHDNRKKFIVIPGHEVAAIEKVVAKKSHYAEVKKFINPPLVASSLKSTNIDNS